MDSPLAGVQAMEGKPGVATDSPGGGKPMLTLLRSISGAFRPVSLPTPVLQCHCLNFTDSRGSLLQTLTSPWATTYH